MSSASKHSRTSHNSSIFRQSYFEVIMTFPHTANWQEKKKIIRGLSASILYLDTSSKEIYLIESFKAYLVSRKTQAYMYNLFDQLLNHFESTKITFIFSENVHISQDPQLTDWSRGLSETQCIFLNRKTPRYSAFFFFFYHSSM